MVRKVKPQPSREPFWMHERTEPIPVVGGVRARSQRGAFTQTWWATAWEEALLSWIDANRLGRGKTYARRGQVVELEIHPGQVLARVQGSRPTPYRLRIAIQPFSDAEWARAVDSLSQQASYSAMLLNGQMPREIEGLFDALGLTLFPSSESDVLMSCSCPDGDVACKHLAAVLLLVGERLDLDPFLLFVLRGRTREQVVQALRERRADRLELAGDTAPSLEQLFPESEPSRPVGIDLARFWQPGPELGALQIRVRPPEVAHEVLQVLGEPGFAQNDVLQERLERVYDAVSARALELAFEEPPAAGPENGNAYPGQ